MRATREKSNHFNFNMLEENIRNLAWLDKINEIKIYFEENIAILKKNITSIDDVMRLLPYLTPSTSFIITGFSPSWLKKLDHFNNLSKIAQCLNIFPAEHWTIFLNHGYGDNDWFRSHLSLHSLQEMLENMTGCADEIDVQCTALFEYLGRDWLRNSFITGHRLAKLLDGHLSQEHCTALLNFLDGEDRWLNKNFNNKM